MKTLYVNRPVLNGDEIRKWALEQGFSKTLEPREMHVTIAFSKKELNWGSLVSNNKKLTVNGGERELKPLGNEGAIVLKFESDVLHNEWKYFIDNGASWDWPEYQAHITITYSGHPNIKSVIPYQGPIVLGGQEFKEVNLNWNKEIKEV